MNKKSLVMLFWIGSVVQPYIFIKEYDYELKEFNTDPEICWIEEFDCMGCDR